MTILSPSRVQISATNPIDLLGQDVRKKSPQTKPKKIANNAPTTALEEDDFPFELISNVAEIESWRKEINRPTYHIHKWWAQRLGSVFRAITLAALSPAGSDVVELFYKPTKIKDVVIFDPFMGSGTTVGEALKIGANAIGRDINPVAYFLVKNALAVHDRQSILKTYGEIEKDVANKIRHFYTTILSDGNKAEVLYYFWVKQVDCPQCEKSVDLFSSYIFAKHAYPKRYPTAQSSCPKCYAVNEVNYSDQKAQCHHCEEIYNPQIGTTRGQKAVCPHCEHSFQVSKTVRDSSTPPRHKLYAKLVLQSDGKKVYLPATHQDEMLFNQSKKELAKRSNAFPIVQIKAGNNTNQVLGYNYRYWHEMFNERQLLGLSILAERISKIEDQTVRELFTCLLSGTLEFNNMFASYKGEGTGAVRHMFSHHILKPERTPLEANLWGTPKSSGSFSTIFNGRIRRAIDYAENPFELIVSEQNGRKTSEKIYGLSEPLSFSIAETFNDYVKGHRVYLSCGDSSNTDIPDKSVDAVITDPPFFDNVHYSELADFFHVWQRHILGTEGNRILDTTRSANEVQHKEQDTFTCRLAGVLDEAHRVLKDNGILAFTYHHSRPDGWDSVLDAIMRADFVITAVQPIKAEMSSAVPKQQAKEPIDLDIVIVCRKRTTLNKSSSQHEAMSQIIRKAENQALRLTSSGRSLSRNDVRVIVTAQLIKSLSISYHRIDALEALSTCKTDTEAHIEQIYNTANKRGHHVAS